MDNLYWINKSTDAYNKRNSYLSQNKPYEIQLTSYEKQEFDEDYINRQKRMIQYSDTRDELIKEEYRRRYESGEYQTEKNRRDLAKFLNFAFPEFSEDYFYENGKAFMKSATGIDVDIDTYWGHIKNVWDSTWKSTGTSVDLATLYLSSLFSEGRLDGEKFNTDKKIIMDRIRTNGQSYRKQDYEDNYGFFGKAFSKVVEQSPNILMNMLFSGGAILLSGGAASVGTLLGMSSNTMNIVKNAIKYGRMGVSSVYAGLTEMGSTALEMSMYGFDDDIIFATSLTQGLFTGLLEGVAEDMVFSGVNNFIDDIFSIGGSNTGKIVDAGFKQALNQFGSSYAKEYVQEPAEEGLESFSGNLLWNLGVRKMYSRYPEYKLIAKSALYNIGSELQTIEGENKFNAKYKSLNDFVSDAFESAKEALWSTSITALGGSSLDVARSYIFGDAGKSVASSKYMNNNNADIILKSEILRGMTKGIKSATSEDMKLQKADTINVTKVGSMYYPTGIDQRQKYAIDNGKYVFAKENQSSLIDSSEIDTSKVVSKAVSPETAENTLQIMYLSNAFDSYAYVDKDGKVMGDNSSKTAEFLAMKNLNGIEYIKIDNSLNDKKSNNTANKTSGNTQSQQSKATNSNPINNNTNNKNQNDSNNNPTNKGQNKNNTQPMSNDAFNLKFDAAKNNVKTEQNAIESQITKKQGFNTYSQFMKKINADKNSIDGNTYYFVDSVGRIMDNEDDAKYIAFKNNKSGSYEIVRITESNDTESILSLFKDNQDPVNQMSKENEKAEDTVAPVKPSSENKKLELDVDQEEDKTVYTESELEYDTKDNETEQNNNNEQGQKENKEQDSDNNGKDNDKTKDSDQIPDGEDSEKSKINYDKVKTISSSLSGTSDEKQKKTYVIETFSDIGYNSPDEVKEEVDRKPVPVHENYDTKESYVKKFSDYIMEMNSANTKTNLEVLFGKRSDSVDKKKVLYSMLLERLKGESTGSKKRDVLLDKLLSNIKAQWITDRRNADITDDIRKEFDEYFGVDDSTVFKEEHKPAKENNKNKIDELNNEEFNIKDAVYIANGIINSSFEQSKNGEVFKTSLSEENIKDISIALANSKTNLNKELLLSLVTAIQNVKNKYEELKGNINSNEYAKDIKERIEESKKNIEHIFNKGYQYSENDKVLIDAYFANELEAAIFYYLSNKTDEQIDAFLNKGKDSKGRDVSIDLFLKNNGYNWNSAERKVTKYYEKFSKKDDVKTIDYTIKNEEQIKVEHNKGNEFVFDDKPFSKNKDEMFVEIPITVIDDEGKTSIKKHHFFNHYAVEERLVSLGVNRSDAKTAAAIMSSFSPSVQEMIYENSSEEIFVKDKLKDGIFGQFRMEEAESGQIVVSEKSDASTIIHEFGHFIWHTNDEVVENITSSFYDSITEDMDNLKKYMESRKEYFRMLLGDDFDTEEALDFIERFSENYSIFGQIVNELYYEREDDENTVIIAGEEYELASVEDQKRFEELVMAFLECYHADNVQNKLDTFPKKIKAAFDRLAEIFRNALNIIKGVKYEPEVSMPQDIYDAISEIYMNDETVPIELKGNIDIDAKSMSRTLYGLTDTNFRFNSRNLDAYTDYYVANLVDIDKSHGKTSTSYDKSVKSIYSMRGKGIFRNADVNKFKGMLESEGFFVQINSQFKYLPESSIDEIKTKIAKKLMYSRQTPVQEGFRLRRLSEALKTASTLRNTDNFIKKKENGEWVPLTVGDVRSMSGSESKIQKGMYSALVDLEGFFFGDEGWISEINRNSSNMNAIKPKSSKITDVRYRIRDSLYTAAEIKGIDVSYNTIDGILFDNRAGFSNDIEIETLYKFMDLLINNDGTPILWIGEASPNNPIRKQGSLFRGPLVDILNYAMVDESATHYNKESYNTVDMDYAKVSYRMMLENSNFKFDKFKVNSVLYDKTMMNLLDFITDENLFDGSQIDSNIYKILNSDTSAEFLENYIDSVKESIGEIENRQSVISYIDSFVSSVGDSLDKMTEVLKNTLVEISEGKDIKTAVERNIMLSEENRKIKYELSESIKKINENAKTIESQNNEIEWLNNLDANKSYNELKSKMDEMESGFIKEKEELTNTINDLNQKLDNIPENEKEIKSLLEKIEDAKILYEKLSESNNELQEKYDLLLESINENAMLDEASITMNAMKSYIATLRNSANENGNAFQSNLYKFFDAFDTVTHNGLEKVINPQDIFFNSMDNAYRYIGIDSTEMMKLCNDLLNFSINAGLFDRSDKNQNVFVVKKSLDSLSIAQMNEMTDILSEMKKESNNAYKEFSERKEKEFKAKRDAIVDEMKEKGSELGITMREYLNNIKVGSEEWKQNNKTKWSAEVELLSPKLRETSHTLYSFIFGGYINGKYNNRNLNTAYNESLRSKKSRYERAFSKIADIFNVYEGTDKYNAEYVEIHRTSMFGETEKIGFMSLNDFETKNGPLTIKSKKNDVYSNYYNSDLKFIADFVTSKYIALKNNKRRYKNALKNMDSLSRHYGYNIEEALIHDMKHGLSDDEATVEYDRMSDKDAMFVKNYFATLSNINNRINEIESTLNGNIGENATYTKDAEMNIFLAARQEGGLDHILGEMLIDDDNSKINGNGLSLGNVLWIMDKFINDSDYRKYYETANVLQEEISSRRMEIEAVKFRTKEKMIGDEENYYTIVSDPDSLMSFYDDNINTNDQFVSNAKVVGKTKGPKNNFTKLRVGGNSPLSLGAINTFVSQIEKQEKYIAFTEILSDMSTLINPNSEHNIIGALQYGYSGKDGSVKEGNTIVRQIKNIIDAITVPEKTKGVIEKMLLYSRNAMIYKSLGFNLVSTMIQTTTYNFVIDDIGLKNAVKYMWKYMVDSAAFGIANLGKKDTTAAEQAILEYSPQMATFINTDTMLSNGGLMEDMLISVNDKLGDKNRGVMAAETFSHIKSLPFVPLDWMNRNIAFATWYAYFNTYINEHPELMNDKEFLRSCANEATQKTLDITPNNFEKDKANIYNSKDNAVKDLLLFTSQINKVFNKLNAKIQGVKFGDGNISDVFKVVGLIGFVGLMNSVINGYIGGGDDDDENSVIIRMLRGVSGEFVENIIPIFGGEVSDFIKGNNFKNSSSLIDFMFSLFSDEGFNWNWTQFFNMFTELTSYFGLPAGFINKIYRAFRDEDVLWLLNYNYANMGR